MSAPPDMAERHGAVLARLAELGLTLAERLHEQAMAADDLKTTADLGLAFHRISRSVRQTLALEARLERDRRRDAREAAASLAQGADDNIPSAGDLIAEDRRVRQRIDDLRKALEPHIWTESEGEERQDLFAMLDEILKYEIFEPDFATQSLDEHIALICGDLRIPSPAPRASPPDLPDAPPDDAGVDRPEAFSPEPRPSG